YEVIYQPRINAPQPCVVVVMVDITERKKVETALRNSEYQLRMVTNNAPLLISYLRRDGVYQFGNSVYQDWMGKDPADLQLEAVLGEEMLRHRTPYLRQAMAGQQVRFEGPMVRRGLGPREAELTYIPDKAENGEVRGIYIFVSDITERKQTEHALRESEDRFRTLFEALPLGTYLIDPDTLAIMDCNQRAAEALGYTREELRTMRLPEIEAQLTPAEIARLCRRGSVTVETGHRTKSGEVRDVIVTARPITVNGRSLNYATALDITERKKVELALQASEAHFRALAENIPQLAWMTDADGWITWYNQRWFDFTGTTLEQMQREGWKRVHHPDHNQRVTLHWNEAMRAGTLWEDTFPLRGRDGNYRWFLSRAFPIRDHDGKITRWFGTNTDITELLEAKQLAERSRAEQQAIVASMAEGVVVFDAAGKLHDINAAALSMHGFQNRESIGRNLNEIGPLFDLHDMEGRVLALDQWPISRAMRGEKFTGYEVCVLRKDGSRKWIASYTGAPVYDATGHLLLVILTLSDVTEQRHAERAIRKMRDELANKNVELEQRVQERTGKLRDTIGELEHFSYTITHDMRAPLRAMQAFGQILREEYNSHLDEAGRDYLRRIVDSASRMDSLITDALNYSKVVQGELPLTPIDPGALLRGIIDSYPQFQPPQAEIHLETGFPLVIGNKAGLTQCFSNLLGNAVKFVEPGQLPQVRVWPEARGPQVRLWFEDNGIGIDPEQQNRVFVMFQRLSKDYEGTGIGLALVRKVVERMKGKVGFESEPGKGSRFWVELQKATP
ncbi:MAG: PAS domain-containing sensor histidine kinase, partial [Verrucomicrobiota bacterium]